MTWLRDTAGGAPFDSVSDADMARWLEAGEAGGWMLELEADGTVTALGKLAGTVYMYRHACDGCGRPDDSAHAAACLVALSLPCDGCGAYPLESCRPGCLSSETLEAVHRD